MVIDFNSPNGPSGAARNGQAHGTVGKREASAVNVDSQATEQSKQRGSAEHASVSLSSQAQHLQAIEEKIRDLPEVDSERVNQIKQAIANGSYTPDSNRIADKLLSFEG